MTTKRTHSAFEEFGKKFTFCRTPGCESQIIQWNASLWGTLHRCPFCAERKWRTGSYLIKESQ